MYLLYTSYIFSINTASIKLIILPYFLENLKLNIPYFHRNLHVLLLHNRRLHRTDPIQIVTFADRASQYTVFISVINLLDAQNFCFTISLFHASTCFEHMCSSSGGQNCITQPLVSSHL